MLFCILRPSVLGGVIVLRNVLVPGIFFPISWKGIKLLVPRHVRRRTYVTITPSPMSRIFPTVCGQNPRWRRMLLCSRSTPFQPVHRRLPRPATRRLRTSGRGRRSKTGTEVHPKVRGNTIKTSTAIEQPGRPPKTIIQVPPQTLPSTEVCAPERREKHSTYKPKAIHTCELECSETDNKILSLAHQMFWIYFLSVRHRRNILAARMSSVHSAASEAVQPYT